MRKYVMVSIGLLFALLIAGCGGNKSSSTTISGVTTEPITSSPTTTYYIKQIDDSPTIYTYNSLSNGNIILTNTSDNKQYTFARIQTVNDDNDTPIYWLVFDTSSYTISRLYLSTPPSDYHPKYMGGSVQGTELTTVISSLNSNTPSTRLCGDDTGASGITDSPALFSQPMGITYDGSQYYYVADTTNNLIRRIDAAGNVTTIAGNTSGTSGSANGNGTLAYFNHPRGITTDGKNLYVADTDNHMIRQIVISTGEVSTIAGVASSAGSNDSNEGASAYFSSPRGITTDGTNLYVADTGNYTIRKIQISGKKHPVSTIAGSVGNSSADTDGVYTNARFLYPTHLTTDGSNLYVVDYNNLGSSKIRRVVIATGSVSTLATISFGFLGGITTDGTNLYLGDDVGSTVNNVITYTPYIRAVNKTSGSLIATTNITNRAGNAPPFGLTTDGTHLYFTSSYYNNIRYY